LKVFFKVTLPLIKRGAITGAVFAYMISFDETVVAIFLSSSHAITLPKKMWDSIRFSIEPILPALSTILILFAILMLEHAPTHTQLSFTRFDQPGLELGSTLWAIWAVLLIIGSANAVNLTDGLDGLAAGAGTFCFGAYTVIAFWQFRYPETYDVAHALDLAVVAAAMAGGCLGFLWWNAAPARIFMGDTGSLAIGTGLATLALTTNTHLLLPVVAGLFVAETVSVILQVGSFRLLGGRRVFSMAPVHHHFELRGWPETTVIIRFWIMSGLCTAVGLGIFYADSIASGAVGG
jgi:phospho-N-acetylmuramoyl-pentapeptide-transferase